MLGSHNDVKRQEGNTRHVDIIISLQDFLFRGKQKGSIRDMLSELNNQKPVQMLRKSLIFAGFKFADLPTLIFSDLQK